MERFAAVCEAAGERRLRACLEFMIFSSVKTIADAERVLDRMVKCRCLPSSARYRPGRR